MSFACLSLVISSSPEIFALVTARGPVNLRRLIASSFSGTLTPIELGSLVPTPFAKSLEVSTIIVNGPGQYNSTTSGIVVTRFSFCIS